MAFLMFSVITVLGQVIAFWIVSVCIYRLYLHPLTRYPGPILAKLTNGYSTYQVARQDTHVKIQRLHEEHVIRYGPNRLVFNTRESLEDIYGQHGNCFKGRAYDAMRLQPVPSVFNASDNGLHHRRRKIIAHRFSDTAVKSAEPVILKHVKKYCSVLYGTPEGAEIGWTEPKNLIHHFVCRTLTLQAAFLAVDLIADLTLGRSTDMLVDPTNRIYDSARKANFRRMGLAMHWPAAFLNNAVRSLRLGDLLLPSIALLGREWHALLSKWILERLQRLQADEGNSNETNMLPMIVRAEDPVTGERLDDAEMTAELTTLLIAGSGTITTGLTSTIFYLSRYPEAYRRVRDESRTSFKSLDDIRLGATLNSCTYLRACFQESMRMSPPQTTPLYREVGAGGTRVHGIHVLEGCEVATTIYALHHNEAYFPDSVTFLPGRWLGAQPSEVKSAWAPFSYGPRNCVGMSLATSEVLLTIATLLWQGDMQIPEEHEVCSIGAGASTLGPGRSREREFQLYDTFGASTEGPYLQFRSRL